MKKLIYTILAAAATLFAVSCARETEREGLDNGTTVEAQFNLGFAGTLTKAYSDGLSATQLVVGVYDRQVGYLEGLSIAPDASDYKYAFASLQTTFTARLVKGHGYDIVFLAVAPDNGIYTIDLEKGTFTVAPEGPSNEELRDAFYAVYSIDRVAAAIDQTVTLTRPFAQINVISDKQDFEAAVKAQVNFGKSALKLTAPSVLNLVDGSVAEPVEYNFTPAPMPVEGAARGAHPNFDPYQSRGDYWLMTNYVLVGEEGADPEIDFTLYAKDSDDALFSYTVPNVALKQNYRTNIYGSVLTTDGHFTVVIEPEYFGELPAPVDGVVPEITMYDSTLPSPSTGGLVKVEVGGKINFKALHPVEGIVPEYSSSIEEVGTIDKDGLFTGVADGKTIVTIYFPAVWNGEPADDPTTPGGDTPGGDTPGGDTPGGDTPGTDPSGEKGTASNPYTVAEALAEVAKLADGAKSAEVYVKGVITDITEISTQYKNATYLIGDSANASEKLTVFRGKYLDGADFTAGDEIKVTDNVVLCGQLQKYVKDNVTTPELVSSKIISLNGTTAPAGIPAVKADAATVNYAARVIQYTVIVGNGSGEPSGEEGSAENPYTVAEALSVIEKLEDGAKTEEDVYVKGVITEVKNVDTGQYGNAEYSIGDSADDTNTLLVYRGYYLDGEKFTAEDQIKKGDQVVVCGKLQKYVKDNVTTPEIANGSKIVSINGEGGETPVDPEPPTVAGTDVLDRAFTGVEGSNYADWSGKKGSGSSAVYAGNTAGGNDAIQMRSNNNNSGIVSTTSGGKLAKVEVVWNANTNDERKLDIYGSNTAYTSPADLYDEAKRGTKIGTLAKGETSLSVSDSYTYVGIRSASGALYLDKVSISWGEGGGTTPSDQPVTATITASDVTVEVGKTANIGATTNSTAAIQYAVADETIATVANGVVTGVKAGSTKVTLSVAAVEGKFTAASKEITVTVKEAGANPPSGEVQTVTVAQFLAAAESNTQKYQLTGTIDGTVNATYGNFDLKDETGSVYVYGLTATELGYGVSNDKSFGTLNLNKGDVITIIGYRGSYNDKVEVMYAYFVEKVSSGTTPDPGTVTTGEYASNVTLTAGANATADVNLTVNDVTVTPNLKLGTSKLYGDATFKIPAGTKTITFYAVGWKGNAATLKFTVGSSELTQVVAANDGATGNGPFILTVTSSDKYTLTLGSAVSAETEVKVETFEGTEKGYRAIIFGVQTK